MVFRCDSLSRHSNKQPPSCELLRLEIRSRCFFQIEHSSVFIGHRLGVWSAEIHLNSSVFYCFHKVLTCFLSFYNANQKWVHTCMVMVQVPSTWWFVGKSKWSKLNGCLEQIVMLHQSTVFTLVYTVPVFYTSWSMSRFGKSVWTKEGKGYRIKTETKAPSRASAAAATARIMQHQW